MEPEKETTQDAKPPIKSLRTYQGDVEEAVLKNNYSATSIFTAEQNKKDQTILGTETQSDYDARNKFFIIIGSTMLLLGIMTVGAMYYMKSNSEIVSQQKTKALISFSEEKMVPMTNSTRDTIITNIIAEKDLFNSPVNSVLYVNITSSSSTPVNIQDLLQLIAPRMPSPLTRSFDGEYMLGIYSFDTNEPFIILTTNDYANSFSGMLKWEKDMVYDLGKLFSIPLDTELTTKEFKDETLKNKDLRILQNTNDKTILLYSFIDKNTLVITTNENLLNAIVGKYNVSKQVR